MVLTDRTGVICFFLATQVPDEIKRYFARAMSESKAENAAMIHFYQVCMFPQRSKAFLKILETIEIYLGSKITSNRVSETYERSTCSKSNPLADTCFRVSTVSSRK